jgi:hypothetical protein
MSPSYSSLDAVSAAVYTTLNVASLLALAPGGVGDAIEQLTARPCVLYAVSERVQAGFGAGNKAGAGGRTLEVDLRLHVFSEYVGFYEAQSVMSECIRLLADPPTVAGYGSWAIYHDETIPLGREIVAGVVVNELVANMRLYVSES